MHAFVGSGQGARMAALVLLFMIMIMSTNGLAAEIDMAIRAGATMPFYEQTFPVGVRLPSSQGLTIRQGGDLAIDARGGILLGAGLRLWANGFFGIEGRYDSGSIDLDVQEPMFFVSSGPPLPITVREFPVASSVSFDVDRIAPLSLNLVLRSGRQKRVVLSGGVSYLPALSLVISQRFTLGLGSFGFALPALEAGGEIDGRIGANVGVSLELPLRQKVALFVEARGFIFESEKFEWDESQFFGLDALGKIVVEEVRKSQKPVEFTPTFCHFAAGVAYRF